jgi:hypothetical protein
MRRLVFLTGLSALLGGCASLSGPAPLPAPVPAPAPEARSEPEATPAQPSPPQVARRRPPAAVRIDNASLESFRASWQQLRDGLSPAQQATLNGAVASLAFAGYGSPTTLPRNLRDSPIVPEMIRHRIDGMTYAEIVDLSREPPAGP